MNLFPREFWTKIKKKIAYKNVLESGENLEISPRIWLAYLTPSDMGTEQYLLGKFKQVWRLKDEMPETFANPKRFLKTHGPLHKSSDIVTLALLEILFDLNTKKRLLPEDQYREWLAVANHFGLWKLRYTLEDAVFKAFDQKNFSLFSSVVNKQIYMDRRLVLSVRSILEDVMTRAGFKRFTIENRTKNIYGVYKKISLKHKSVNDIYDIHGFRLLVTTRKECYRAVDILHQLWPCFPERLKDYILNPKKNGYQSIHTVLSCLEKKPIEFQVRTYEMDSIASSGSANHADYKGPAGKITLNEAS